VAMVLYYLPTRSYSLNGLARYRVVNCQRDIVCWPLSAASGCLN